MIKSREMQKVNFLANEVKDRCNLSFTSLDSKCQMIIWPCGAYHELALWRSDLKSECSLVRLSRSQGIYFVVVLGYRHRSPSVCISLW